MDQPTLFESRQVAMDTTCLNAYLPIPGFGVLPVNAFLLRAQQPVLIDTGMAAVGEVLRQQLYDLIDPRDLRYIWITHTDPDHLGNLKQILEDAPQARLVTTYLGMGKMAMHGIPLDRVYLLNPGQALDVGDRQLLAISPPTYDAPETCGLLDTMHNTLFSADCFGALMQAPVESAQQLSSTALRDGCISWAAVDAPWLHYVDSKQFHQALDKIAQLNINTILSSHLPAAQGLTHDLLNHLKDAVEAPRFVGPDQAALESMLAA
jgi:flavorubredoxin